jgi:hypothetical protein
MKARTDMRGTKSCKAIVLWVALGWAMVVAPASARNTEHLLPIQPTLAKPEARNAIGNDIPVSFGAALPDGMTIIDDRVTVRGKADPRPSVLRSGNQPLTDEQACSIAFINAVAELVKMARAAGATAVLGVVSNYDDKERDSTERYECHAGQTRTIVDLKALLAKPGRAGSPTVIGKNEVSKQHRSPVPPPTGFAEPDDLTAVPLSDAGRERYRHYLTLPAPKAFVIFEGGTWRFYHSDTDAMTKALDYCQQIAKTCWLYAVDHRVVWSADPARRVGRSAQLGNE